MAIIKPKIEVVIDTSRPVQEICDIIATVLAYHVGNESKVLNGIKESVERHIAKIHEKSPV